LRIVEKTIERPEVSKQFWAEAEIAINNELNAMQRALNSWLKREIPKQYQEQFEALAKSVAESEKIVIDIAAIFRSYETQQATATLLNRMRLEAVKELAQAIHNGSLEIERLFRLTKQRIIDEYSLNSALWQAYESGDLRNFASVLATENPTFAKLYNTIVANEGFIEVDGRHFKPEYYVEMVARTRFHEAQSQATLDLCNVVGTDLVIISNHNTETELCQEHEGKIYSISGESDKYPLLEDYPPFHPNCLHTMYLWFDTVEAAERNAMGGSNASFD